MYRYVLAILSTEFLLLMIVIIVEMINKRRIKMILNSSRTINKNPVKTIPIPRAEKKPALKTKIMNRLSIVMICKDKDITQMQTEPILYPV